MSMYAYAVNKVIFLIENVARISSENYNTYCKLQMWDVVVSCYPLGVKTSCWTVECTWDSMMRFVFQRPCAFIVKYRIVSFYVHFIYRKYSIKNIRLCTKCGPISTKNYFVFVAKVSRLLLHQQRR